MKTLHKNVKAELADKPIRVDIEAYTRGGSKSPSLYIFIYKNHRFTPFAAKRAKLYLTFEGGLRLLYDGVIEAVMRRPNYFLDMVKKAPII